MLNLIVNAVHANVRSERVARVADLPLRKMFLLRDNVPYGTARLVAHVYPISIH